MRIAYLTVIGALTLFAQPGGVEYIAKLLERAAVPAAPAPPPAAGTATPAGIRQLHLTWNTLVPPPPPQGPRTGAPSGLGTRGERRFASGMRRQRFPQLGRDSLVVVAIDAQGRSSHWDVIEDPRILRAEEPTATGELRGRILTRPDADFLFAFPDNVPVSSVRIYQPRWTSAEPMLELVAEMAVSR